MEFDTPLDYAAFQLSPKRSRCELFVSCNGTTEKLASGLVKPFMTHLKVVEEQVALSVKSIKLEVDKRKNVDSWFTKGTLERFVRFVSTPEIVELVITFDAEMSQLEAARRIYSQGSSDQFSSNLGDGRLSTAAKDDATKKELLRAIDVRLSALKQDLSTACARAAAAGFNQDTVTDLQMFAERFGAIRLNETCCKYISLHDRRPELFNSALKSRFGDQAMRCSYSSDMSIDDDPPTIIAEQSSSAATDQSAKPSLKSSSSSIFPSRLRSTPAAGELSTGKDETVSQNQGKKEEVGNEEPLAQTATQPSSRRLSVQDRINLFENKQKEVGSAAGSGGKPAIAKPELCRVSSELAAPAAVLRRWSGASDMSIDLSGEKKEAENPLCVPKLPVNDSPASSKMEAKKSQHDLNDHVSGRGEDDEVKTVSGTQSTVSSSIRHEGSAGSNQPTSNLEKTLSWSSGTKLEDDIFKVRLKPTTKIKSLHGGNQQQQDIRPSGVETFQSHHVANLESDSKPGGSGSKFQEAVAASQHRGFKIGSLRSQNRHNHLAETEEVDNAPMEKQFDEQKTKVQRDERRYLDGFSTTPPSGNFVVEGYGSIPVEAVVEQAHRSRPSKGNQEFNDLKLKANELEKLYAEHKLRVPGDQPRRTKPPDDGADQAASLPYRKPVVEHVPTQVSEPNTLLKSTVPVPVPVPVIEVDGQIHRDPLQRSFSEVGSSDDSRGKFYDSYMKKREERLREQWDSNKSEKEARMKAMHDSVERSSAEMKAKLLWSADRNDSVSSARRRADRLRSFNARSAMKREQPLDFGQLEDEDLSEFSELKLISNGVSRNAQGKKPLPINIKNLSTSTPRNTGAAVPRSGTKVASSSGRRRVQTDNLVAQSVPNFSDLRKENTKPYSVASKAAARSQLRNHTRSRSTNEEMTSVKEEKSGRSQSLRKNSPTPESLEVKFEREQSEGVHMKPKSFHRKNNSSGGNATAKLKVSMKTEEYEADVMEDNDEEEFDTEEIEGQNVIDDSMELKDVESESGIGVEDTVTMGGESTMSMSWNTHTHHPFSYTHDNDASDSVESWNLHDLNSSETDVAHMRKKWGSAEKHILVANSSGGQSRKDMKRGFKRLLNFGRKSRGTDSMADWISATTSEGDDDTEDGRDVSNRSSEDLRKSRMGYSHGLPFEESDYFSDQVHALQSSIPTPPANFRLREREDQLSGSSIKGPRSFFSLSSFRSKGSESKLR